MINEAFDINSLHYINAHPDLYDDMYEKYHSIKKGPREYQKLNEQEKEEINILSLLDRLGFPMHQTGTYLFKEMIKQGISILQVASTKEEQEVVRQIMKAQFSQFYVDTARNNLDMGIKTFHYIVAMSYAQVNMKRFNQSKMNKKGIDLYNQDYMEQAYKIADYCINQNKKQTNDSAVKTETSLLIKA